MLRKNNLNNFQSKIPRLGSGSRSRKNSISSQKENRSITGRYSEYNATKGIGYNAVHTQIQLSTTSVEKKTAESHKRNISLKSQIPSLSIVKKENLKNSRLSNWKRQVNSTMKSRNLNGNNKCKLQKPKWFSKTYYQTECITQRRSMRCQKWTGNIEV